MPAQPALPGGATLVFAGMTRFTLGPGETRSFDPVVLANDAGKTPPPCAALAWTTAWRASEPLSAAFIRQSVRTELGRGRWGTSDLGCSALELRNDGSSTVDAELAYTIASR